MLSHTLGNTAPNAPVAAPKGKAQAKGGVKSKAKAKATPTERVSGLLLICVWMSCQSGNAGRVGGLNAGPSPIRNVLASNRAPPSARASVRSRDQSFIHACVRSSVNQVVLPPSVCSSVAHQSFSHPFAQ